MKLLKPDAFKKAVEEIDLHKLSAEGKRNLIIDLEGTLISRETWEVLPEKLNWIQKAKDAGFKIHLISNTIRIRRAKEISKLFGVPIIPASFKPLPFSFIKATKVLGTRASNSAVIGDQLFMDVLGGNLLGFYTILVKPMSNERKLSRKLMRWLEGLFFKPGTSGLSL